MFSAADTVLHSPLAWLTLARQLFARFPGAGRCIGRETWSRSGGGYASQ